jgi:tetratricopeptide (TPR) repeat protein
MFKHLFASMNDMLDEVLAEYPSSTGVKRRQLTEKLQSLKAMSDECIEDWLLFEEKLGHTLQASGILKLTEGGEPPHPELAEKRSDRFVKAQGYYKLHMYEKAAVQFSELLQVQPDFTLARLYLAMSLLHQGRNEESYAHFQFLSQLTDHTQLKAISLNVMGCIQVQQNHMDKACELFTLAYETDPSSVEPLVELGLCRVNQGSLHFALAGMRSSCPPL